MRRHYHSTSSSGSDEDIEGTPCSVSSLSKVDDFDQDLHQFLCFGLGPRNEGDWREVVHNRGKKARVYTQKEIDVFSENFRQYFHGLTGHRLNKFQLTLSTHKYVSMLEFARVRDRVLATMFERRPKIWELGAGSGADGIAFLMDLDPQELVLCQRSVPDGTHHGEEYDHSLQEYNIMCENIKDFVQTVKLDARIDIEGGVVEPSRKTRRILIKCKHKLAENFILSHADKPGTEVDIIYLDPSWDDDHDSGGNTMHGREMTPSELFARLEKIIWAPIRNMGIKVGCYVIKTRWNWLKVQQYMDTIDSEFQAMYSIRTHPFRPNPTQPRPEGYGGVQGVYHYMILTHKEYKTIDVNNSQMYWDIVRDKVPVWIKKSTCVGVTRPEYSNHIPFPEVTETKPSNEKDYFMIQPVGRRKKDAERTKGAKTPQEQTSYHSQKFEPATRDGGRMEESGSSEEEDEPNPYATPNPYDMLPTDSRLLKKPAAVQSCKR